MKLRNLIGSSKYCLKACKEDLNHFPGWGFLKGKVKQEKINLIALRNELNRLNGMDRIVVPYEVMRFGFEANIPRVSYNCECFEPIDRKHKYCPNCGRRILWEKVK